MNKLTLEETKAKALYFASRGFYVFPVHGVTDRGGKLFCTCNKVDCSAIGKHPLHRAWANEATTDPKKIELIFKEINGASPNIAVATGELSGITVVDVDTDKGGLERWETICEQVKVPETFTVRTGSGGYHFYFKYSPAYKTKSDALGQGIDIRNDGGYCVAPPSMHKSGGQYSVIQDLPLAEMPAGLLKYSLPKPDAKSTLSLKKAEELLKYIPSGNYDTWLKVGCILGRAFEQSDEAFQLFREWSDKDYQKNDKNSAARARKLQDIYYQASAEASSDGSTVGVGTLFQMAKSHGYSGIDKSQKISIAGFCYYAPENCYLFLSNGSKWLAKGIDSAIPAVYEDGIVTKASDWLRDHKMVSSYIKSSDLPTGIIAGYLESKGVPIPEEGHRIANLYKANRGLPPLREGLASPVRVPEVAEVKPVQIQQATYAPPKRRAAVAPKIKPVEKVIYDAPAWMFEK